MADEQPTNDVEEVVEDQTQEPQEEAPVEEQQEEPVQEAEEEVPQEEDKEEVPEEKPSRREQLRIQQLLDKYGPPPERRNPPKREDALDYEHALDADPAVIQQLEADRRREGEAQFNAGLEQAKSIQFHTRLEIDAPRVEAKYKFLDASDKDNFDPVRANAMNQLYLNQVGYNPGDPAKGIPETVANPNVRYKDFVEAQMEFAEALMADRQINTAKNIAKQAATTGLRPDGSSAKRLNLNKAPELMTNEELNAVIRQGIPEAK